MEDKERENKDDNNDVINITDEELFGMPNKALLIKKNKKKEKRKGNEGYKNSNGREYGQ